MEVRTIWICFKSQWIDDPSFDHGKHLDASEKNRENRKQNLFVNVILCALFFD
jgi:hypothetical protein